MQRIVLALVAHQTYHQTDLSARVLAQQELKPGCTAAAAAVVVAAAVVAVVVTKD